MISKELSKIAWVIASVRIADSLDDYISNIRKVISKEFKGSKYRIFKRDGVVSFVNNKGREFIRIRTPSPLYKEYVMTVGIGNLSTKEFENPDKNDFADFANEYFKHEIDDIDYWNESFGIKGTDSKYSINEIISFAKTLHLIPDETGKNNVSFSTREHGDVSEGHASPIDIRYMSDFEKKFKNRFSGIRTKIEVVDEWVYLNVNV